MEALIKQFLDPIDFGSLLLVASRELPPLADYCDARGVDFQQQTLDTPLDLSSRVDLAVVWAFESAPTRTIEALLGTLKNLKTDQIWVLSSREIPALNFQDFVALGFHRDPLPDPIPYTSYSYNLATYNHKRQWNNPRFWANPEMWHHRF